jgi:hypothetical protein
VVTQPAEKRKASRTSVSWAAARRDCSHKWLAPASGGVRTTATQLAALGNVGLVLTPPAAWG